MIHLSRKIKEDVICITLRVKHSLRCSLDRERDAQTYHVDQRVGCIGGIDGERFQCSSHHNNPNSEFGNFHYIFGNLIC